MDESSSDWSRFWSLDVLGQDFYNRDAGSGVSAGDIPLRLTVAPIVALPFGPGRRWLNRGVASHVLGGWRAAAVYTREQRVALRHHGHIVRILQCRAHPHESAEHDR